ncbi:phenylalanine--tRNA ligase subunit alpha [Candidatus Woesearchaeota archaeon]|nr:phenylalanine--tRNA ligase subunit alpha [Candidatus Woesearchaeota archaeon]
MGVVSEEILARLHPLEVKVLPHLKDGILLSTLAKNAKLQEVEAMRACQWLENKKALTLEQATTHTLTLDVNGKKAIKKGMPEMRFLLAIKKTAKTQDQLEKTGLDRQEIGVSIGLLKKAGLLNMKGKKFTITAKGKKLDAKKSPEIIILKKLGKSKSLETLPAKDQELVKNLRKRRQYLIIKEHKGRKIKLTELGKELAKTDVKKLKFEERITKEDLETGAWKKKKYRAYDVSVNVPSIPQGKLHFVQEAIDYIRKIWVEMGFEEMTGDMCQSAFWDLDALFVPQDHPAREVQDTFYLSHPEKTNFDKIAFERVRDVHENGGNTGSKGWEYDYSKEEAEQLLLRTHTTVLSAQTLWKIRNGEANLPGKYFSVSKVFRNEKLDWKHLFEFHQVEGIVVDKNVTFAQLIGYLKIFFAKMGFEKIRLRPHEFPYTYCSVEVDVWNDRKQQWIELGGAGIFRPEVTKTLIGEEIPVLAWGLGMERIIVEYFDIHDLRDLYRNDIKQLREMKRFIKYSQA